MSPALLLLFFAFPSHLCSDLLLVFWRWWRRLQWQVGDSAWSCCGYSWFQKLHPAATDPAGLHTQPVLEASGGFLNPSGFLAPETLRTTREVCPTSGALWQETWPRRENAPLEQKAYLVLKWLHPETPKCSCITFLTDLAGPIFCYLG